MMLNMVWPKTVQNQCYFRLIDDYFENFQNTFSLDMYWNSNPLKYQSLNKFSICYLA